MLRNVLPRRVLMQRRLLGISQRRLARESKISVATLCRIEAGQADDMLLSTALRLFTALQASSDYFLGYDKPDGLTRRMVPLGVFPVRFEEGNGASQKCPWCDALLNPYREHSQGECILMNKERGKSPETLAAAYSLPLEAILAIIKEAESQLRGRT